MNKYLSADEIKRVLKIYFINYLNTLKKSITLSNTFTTANSTIANKGNTKFKNKK